MKLRRLASSSFIIAALCTLATPHAHARLLGIDVSSYQGTGVNWPTAKSGGITFAWAKATEGAGVNDADYTYNMSNGKTAGVIMGSYHYAHSELNTAATEASHFWGKASTYTKSDGLTLMPMLDMESSALTGDVGSTSVSDWVNDWCTEIIQDGANNGVTLTPIIYVSACNAHYFDSTVAQWGADIANYSGNDPQSSTPWTACSSGDVWGGWDFWQYSSSGGVPGYSGNIDKDVFNGTDMSAWVAGQNTNSAIYYWDPQAISGSNPYTGSMTGTWETAKWSYASSGLATPIAWANGKAACFGVHTGTGTPAYTITMNSNHIVAGFFDGALAPNSCDVTISGTGTISLASGAQALDAKNASDGSLAKLRLYVNIAGSGQMFPEGNGQSFLHGSNTFSGGFQLGYPTVPFSGTVNFNNGNAFGTGTITLSTNGTGGTINFDTTGAVTVTNAVANDGNCTNNIVGSTAGVTFSGNWNLSKGLLTLGGGSTATKKTIIGGAISGTKGLTIYNSATIVLTGTNTYTGTTTINSPAVLQLDGTGKLGGGVYPSAIVNNGTFIDSSTATQTISGNISGSGPLRVADAGTLTLTGANTFSGGTTVSNSGVLVVSADSGLGTAAGALTLSGGTLKNNNVAVTIGSSRTITLGASGGYFDASGSSAISLTLNSTLTGAGAVLINKDLGPVVLNNAANNYTGNTIIGTNGPGYSEGASQAQLKMGTSNVIPKGSGFGNVIINKASGGILDINGTTQGVNGLSGDGSIDNSTGNGSLTVGNNNATSTFTGIIKNTGGTLSLTKAGTGTLTLGGDNVYSGNTSITAGTLALGGTGYISSPVINLSAGATFDVSAISSFALSASSINASGATSPATIKGGTTVDLGSGPITLNYDGVRPALTISQGTLSLNGNAFTVNGSVLPDGTYILIQQTTGNIAAAGSFTVTGSALGGKPASVNVVGGSALLVLNIGPTITSQPQSNTIDKGETASFTVTVSGTAPFSYQWRLNGSDILGATSSSYNKPNAQLADAGTYSVVVTNAIGSVTSTEAVLTFNTCAISLESIDVTNGVNATLTYNVDAAQSYTFQYTDNLSDAQWQDLNSYGSGNSTLTISDFSVTNTQRFYRLTSSCAASSPAGFITLSMPGNSDTYVSMPFVRMGSSIATVVSYSDNVLTVTQSDGQPWAPNQFVYVSGSQSNTYYARFASGALNGMIFPVISNDTNTLTVEFDSGDFSGVSAGDLVYVEPYWTMNSIFPGGTGANVSPTSGNRNTEILIPDLTTSGINLSAAKVYYFNAGLWKQVGQGSVDHGDDIIQPNTYFIVRHNVSTNATLYAAGRAIAANIIIPIAGGVVQPSDPNGTRDNYIGLTRPVAVSLDDSQLISSGAFAESPLPGDRGDELLTFDNTAIAKNKSSSAVYYYWSGAWRKVGAGSTVVGSDVVFTPGTGVILRRGTNAPATWTNTPSY